MLTFARSLVAMALVATALASTSVQAAEVSEWRAGATPPLVLRDLDGREVRLDAYRGRTVVVNFWATWCAPCVAEMPSIMLLREKYAKQGLDVIGVNLQENAARIRPFLAQHEIDFTVVRDHDGSARDAWRVSVYPTSFVIGPDQKIAFVVVGEANWSGPPIEPRIRSILFP
jgi:thiol-disulfide isomerase/thioredoxin